MKGRTRFSEKSLSKIVNAAAASVPGVVRISSSWADIGTRSYPRCDIHSDQLAGVVQVTSFIAVSWPSPATDVAAKVQRTVTAWVHALTGLRCTRVDVTVEQAIDGDRRVQPAEVAAAAEAPALRSVRVQLGTPVVSPVTAPEVSLRTPVTPAERVLAPTALPRPALLREVPMPTPVQLRPVHNPGPAPLRAPVAPPAGQVRSPRVPVARPARKVRPPEPVPLTPVRIPVAAPLRPVTVPEAAAPRISVPRQLALTPVYVRGVRFVPAAERGGRRRVL